MIRLPDYVVKPFLDSIKTKIQADTLASAQAQGELPAPTVKRNGAPKRLPAAKRPGIREVARVILRDQGFMAFYKGFTASMLNTFSMQLCVRIAIMR